MKKIVLLSLVVLVVATSCKDKTTGSVNGHENGHEWVDLGLSVKWATCNVGAISPEYYGDYFAWGETSRKSTYTDDNSLTYRKSMGSIAGDPQYDAARANWGGTWRLPTAEEIDELVNRCQQPEWTTLNGVNGYKITGPNGNSIFLPAAGRIYESSREYAGEYGYYWSATPDYRYGIDAANALYFYSDDFERNWYNLRYGFPVRPVTE